MNYYIHHIREFIDTLIDFFLTNGPILGFVGVFSEAFITILPLSALVALNVGAFGYVFGIVLSWFATVAGSYLCFSLFRFFSKKLFKTKFMKKKKNLTNNIIKMKNINFSSLVILIAVPFTISSLINLLAGLSLMSRKKFLAAILIGKFFMITFWGYVGGNIVKNGLNLKSVIISIILIILAYIISKIVNKKMNIEGE